jgi:hypothetical protein
MAGTFINYDFTGILEANAVINAVLQSLPNVKASLLRNIVAMYKGVIDNRQLTQNIRYTGTYEQSLKIVAGGSTQDPNVSLVLDPSGPGADRLEIYWKVLEFGANPSPNVLSAPIKEWVGVKGYGGAAGAKHVSNRIKTRGIDAHPILSIIFILTPPNGDIAGLTKEAITIAEIEVQKMMDLSFHSRHIYD